MGVLIDQDLQWNSHHNYISRKVAKGVRIFLQGSFLSYLEFIHICRTARSHGEEPTRPNLIVYC